MNNYYIRFCKIPHDERSYNFMRNRKEIGVSVFKADDNGMPILENAEQVKSLWARLNRRHYLVTGDVVGVGQDGEPLLQNVRVVRRLRLDREQLEEMITAAFERLFKYKFKTAFYDQVSGSGEYLGMDSHRNFKICGDPLLSDNGGLLFVQWCGGASYRGVFYTNDLREPQEKDFAPSLEKTAFLFEKLRSDVAWISELSDISKSTLYKFKNQCTASEKTIKILSKLVDKRYYVDFINSKYYK